MDATYFPLNDLYAQSAHKISTSRPRLISDFRESLPDFCAVYRRLNSLHFKTEAKAKHLKAETLKVRAGRASKFKSRNSESRE